MQYSGTADHWFQVGGPAHSLIGGGDHLYALTPDEQVIVRFEGAPNQWTKIGGPGAAFVACGSQLWGLSPETRNVWHFSGTPNQWTQMSGPAKSIVAYTKGGLRAIGVNTRSVLKLQGSNF
jgi:hypothetical protein